MQEFFRNVAQPILRILLFGGIAYIVIRFIGDIRTIAAHIRKKENKKERE